PMPARWPTATATTVAPSTRLLPSSITGRSWARRGCPSCPVTRPTASPPASSCTNISSTRRCCAASPVATQRPSCCR
ncbi:MAG: Phosphoribosylglycinamide formyltransferase, partial [uncultured Rubellimicrobium sp.]